MAHIAFLTIPGRRDPHSTVFLLKIPFMLISEGQQAVKLRSDTPPPPPPPPPLQMFSFFFLFLTPSRRGVDCLRWCGSDTQGRTWDLWCIIPTLLLLVMQNWGVWWKHLIPCLMPPNTMLLKCCNERKANYCILNTIYYILTISILFYTYCILGTRLKILRPGFNVPLQQNNCSQSCPPPW